MDSAVLLCSVACLINCILQAVYITHPATVYLVFHGAFISFRAIAILNGAAALFSWRGTAPVSEPEIVRAVRLAGLWARRNGLWLDFGSSSSGSVATLKEVPMLRTTYPNKVFDYMAAGRPTVLAIDGAIREVIE